MDGLLEIVATVEQKTAANLPRSSADYMENGLLYCGKCHTPKEFRGNFLGMVKVVPCLCRCRSEKLVAEEQQRKAEKQQARIRQHRRASFLESDMQHWNFAADDGADPRIMRAAKTTLPTLRSSGSRAKACCCMVVWEPARLLLQPALPMP